MHRETGSAGAGVAQALAAYVLWGVAPIYWKALEALPAGELLAEAACADGMMQQAIDTIGMERLNSVAGSIWSYKISARRP